MMAKSHLAIGTCGYLVLAASGLVEVSPAAAGAAILGSLLPDIDTPYSALGRFIPFVSVPFYKHIGHRSFTHSIAGFLATTIIAVIFARFFDIPGPAIAFLAGYALHILADLPAGGCLLFYPFNRVRVKCWPDIRTGSLSEIAVAGTIIALLLLLAWKFSINTHISCFFYHYRPEI